MNESKVCLHMINLELYYIFELCMHLVKESQTNLKYLFLYWTIHCKDVMKTENVIACLIYFIGINSRSLYRYTDFSLYSFIKPF